MICKKTAKHSNQKKVNTVIVDNNHQLITRSRNRYKNESSISGTKLSKTDTKSTTTKESINSKKIADKKSGKPSLNGKSLRFSNKTDQKSTSNNKKSNNNNKSNKISKIKNITKIVKKVQNKANKTCNQLKEVVKRELRNNCKIGFEVNVKPEININNNILHKNTLNRNSKQNIDTIVLNNKDNEKVNSKINSTKPNSRANLCSKLFPTLNGVNKSTNSSKINNKLEKEQNSDSKSSKIKANLKSESKPVNDLKGKSTKIVINNNKKTKPKTKSNNKIGKSFTIKKKPNSSSKKMKNKVKKETKKVMKTTKSSNNKKNDKLKKESTKLDKTLSAKEEESNVLSVRRGHRVASLNASAKVRLLCENESEKHDMNDEYSVVSKSKVKSKSDSFDDKQQKKYKNDGKVKKENKCRALVPVDNSNKQLAVRKRKNIDNSIEIIDTRSCKRMASLNASAIMAASYSPERYRRSKSIESNHSNGSVQMMTISQTVSHIQISPNGLNGVHVNQNRVILKSQKHQTIETVKQMKVSNKIKDRLLGIAKLEKQEEKAKQKRKGRPPKSIADDNHSIGSDDQSLASGAGVSEYQATKVQVTKVTHINTSQGKDKKKSGHQIDAILERDSAVVHKYQVQTKSTIEMQTTFNSTNGSTIANVTTITAPQPTPTIGSTPQTHVHLSSAPTQPFPHHMLPPTNSGYPMPTYFNFAGATPVLQVHNNQYQAIASTPTINPMPIINLSEPYPTHYSSAFSVPHFATHPHPTQMTQNPFNYYHTGIYQPAGPLLQPFQDPCLIHKPIPFHPPVSQVNHIHNTSQFPNATLSTQNSQTFPTELTQAFHPTGQYFHPMATPLRHPQTVYFHAVPQTNASLTPNATTFTFLNPGIHYTHPTFVSSEPVVTNETPIVTNDMTYLNRKVNANSSTAAQTSDTSISNDINSRHHLSKSIQCSPQSRDNYQTLNEKQMCDSTNSLVQMSHMIDRTSMVGHNSSNKRTNKCDHKTDKRKKSMLLNPVSQRNADQVMVRDNNTQTLTTECEEYESQSEECLADNSVSLAMACNQNKVNCQQKPMKTVCVQINTSLPSVSTPPSVPSLPSTPSPSNRLLPLKRPVRKRNSHGWSWEGKPTDKYVYLNNEEQSYIRKCYSAIRHLEGDVIRVRDCVLLRSGPRKTDLPFVAKIAALWETSEGEMMMSLLWYYRPEHTDLEYYSNQMVSEIFASKHRDVNSVACIDDKCYVLTYNEFCRYKRLKLLKQSPLSTCVTSITVPPMDESYPRMDRMPPTRVFPELVFCCRKVYDYRQKRILKNPI